ncbi:MAG: hypothetical protein ACYC3G_03555 [Minisyncoccota bacterium]
MKLNLSVFLASIGMFLVMLGAGTSDADLSPYSFQVGMTMGIIGIIALFFAFEENRNPKRFLRIVRYYRNYFFR